MLHCFGNLLTLFSHVGHVCCGHFVSCVLIGPASQSSLSESSYWICLELLPCSERVEDIEYDLVEDAEEDSDYKSDFDSEEEDSNDIFDKIAKY